MSRRFFVILFLLVLLVAVKNLEAYTFFTSTESVRPWPVSEEAVLSQDGTWITPKVTVPYYFPLSGYSAQELGAFEQAAELIQRRTKNCIAFSRRFTSDSPNAVHLMRTDNNGNFPYVCKTINGYSTPGAGQVIYAARHSNPKFGCLQGGPDDRDTVRLLMNLLGVANEFHRTDRHTAIDVYQDYRDRIMPELLGPGGSAVLFDIKDNLIQHGDELDIQSVTMVAPDRFSTSPARPLFHSKIGDVPRQALLSYGDCQALNHLYGCRITDCNPPPSDNPAFQDHFSKPIVKYINCWDTTLNLQKPRDLMKFKPIKDDPSNPSANVLIYSVDPNNQYIQVKHTQPPVASSTVELQLLRQIKTSAELNIKIIGRRPSDNIPAVEGQLQLRLVCLPRLALNGFRMSCENAEFAGSSDIKCIHRGHRTEHLSTCTESKQIPPNYSFQLAEISGQTVLRDVTAYGNLDPGTWITDPQSGYIINGGGPVSPNQTIQFTATYVDTVSHTTSVLVQTIQFICSDDFIQVKRIVLT